MSADYSGTSVPTLNNSPASSWNTDAAKKSHVNDLYLVTGSGASAGNLYAFEEYAKPLVKNATPGEIVTFTDGGDNAPITSASVSLSPIQSLNGYDSPWPGGGGKNKFPDCAISGSGDVSITQNGSKYTLSGTASAYTQCVSTETFTLGAGTYTLSEGGWKAGVYFQLRSPDGQTIYASTAGAASNTFTLSESITLKARIIINANVATNLTISIQVETGSTATDWTPYSNICPISGHTGAELNIAAEYESEDATTYSVTFTDQGTVYGGTYDFVSGKLRVTHGTLTYNGTASLVWNTGLNCAQINSLFAGITTANIANFKSDMFKPHINSGVANMNNEFTVGGSRELLIKAPSLFTNATDAKAYFTANPVQFVGVLATPLEYTLSPQQLTTLQGQNVVWGSGPITQLTYTSNQFTPSFSWFETWTVPKITRDNGQVIVLPKPQEYTPEIYDVDAATTGRNAAGTMIRDRVARKHKFNYKFAALSQQDATEILNAVQDVSFTLTTASPETGAKTNYRVYVGDRSLPVYWMPTHATASWMYSSLSLNLIEM